MADASMPELIFALIAPIGVDLDLIARVLDERLREKRYEPIVFRLTKLMEDVPTKIKLTDSPSFVGGYREKIAYANEVRKLLGDDALAALAVSAIRSYRSNEWNRLRASGDKTVPDEQAQEGVALPNRAYIVRQFKRPEEVSLLRRVYGRHAIIVSAFAPRDLRLKQIVEKEKKSRGGIVADLDAQQDALAIVSQDTKELPDEHGQNVRDAFPLADVFIDASSEDACKRTLGRFLDLFFGNNRVSPTADEYGMYAAKSASLRSCDLSRQVGAAIFRETREVIAQGCNEVPKAGGGTYWSGDVDDQRDIVIGRDPNEVRKFELIVDIIDRLRRAGKLSQDLQSIEDAISITKSLLQLDGEGSIIDSKIMDLLEFGRIIHAEMSAICDAARIGVPVRGATLYCTTFPCHICAKHIVASGIARVVYLEPYPKSYAQDLHSDSIDTEGTGAPRKVRFDAFIGVSPYRYRDLFEKGRRKYSGGEAQTWNKGELRPMIDQFHPAYFQAETQIASQTEERLNALDIE